MSATLPRENMTKEIHEQHRTDIMSCRKLPAECRMATNVRALPTKLASFSKILTGCREE